MSWSPLPLRGGRRCVLQIYHEGPNDSVGRNSTCRTPAPTPTQGRVPSHEDVAVPGASRETAPGMRGALRWVRSTVHPDRRFLLLHVDMTVVGHDPLSRAIDLGPEVQLRQHPLERKVPRVRAAHPFGDVEVFRRPAIASPSIALTNGKPRGVADDPAPVLVAGERPPRAGKVHLGESRLTPECRQPQQQHTRQRRADPNRDSRHHAIAAL